MHWIYVIRLHIVDFQRILTRPVRYNMSARGKSAMLEGRDVAAVKVNNLYHELRSWFRCPDEKLLVGDASFRHKFKTMDVEVKQKIKR